MTSSSDDGVSTAGAPSAPSPSSHFMRRSAAWCFAGSLWRRPPRLDTRRSDAPSRLSRMTAHQANRVPSRAISCTEEVRSFIAFRRCARTITIDADWRADRGERTHSALQCFAGALRNPEPFSLAV